MPRRADRSLCECRRCLADSPAGVWLPRGEYRVHQSVEATLRDENLLSEALTQDPSEDSLDAVNANVIASTVTDEGPDIDAHSRLWSSRADVQAAVSLGDTNDSPILATDIQPSVERLLRTHSSPTFIPHHPNQTPAPQPPPSSPPIPPPRPASPPTQILAGRRRNHKVMMVLKRIEEGLAQQSQSIQQVGSLQGLLPFHSHIKNISDALGKVTSQSSDVKAEKGRLQQRLSHLFALYTEKRTFFTNAGVLPDGPVEFNAGKSFDA